MEPTGGVTRRRHRRRPDSGVALVEFGLIAPILFTILFGIVEFGWAFLQSLDIRHGAREGSRLAAVNFKLTSSTGAAQTDELVAELCDRIDAPTGVVVHISFEDGPDSPTPDSPTDIGDRVVVEVTDPDLDTLTGFFDWVLGGVELSSTVKSRLEQTATYAATGVDGEACT